MKEYKCHKTVRAGKITEVFEDRTVIGGTCIILEQRIQKNFVQKRFQEANVGDYLIEYKDGYTSISPAEAFESGYNEIVPAHQERVIAERSDLADKAIKLSAFRDTEVYEKLPQEDRDLLTSQLASMDEYLEILKRRVNRF